MSDAPDEGAPPRWYQGHLPVPGLYRNGVLYPHAAAPLHDRMMQSDDVATRTDQCS